MAKKVLDVCHGPWRLFGVLAGDEMAIQSYCVLPRAKEKRRWIGRGCETIKLAGQWHVYSVQCL